MVTSTLCTVWHAMVAVTYLPLFVTILFRGLPGIWKSRHRLILCWLVFSPNGDGKNDVLDMSLLKYKENVTFQIVDRQGKKLFEGDTKNNYIWDGKQNGKVLPTSSYWYIMQWQDFVDSPPVKYTGWILLKNRNSD